MMIDEIINELNENDVIDLTPAWLQAEYNRLNESYFDGKLGPCSFGLFTTGRGSEGGVLGWFKITGTGIYISKSTRRMFTKTYWGDKEFITKNNFAEVCKPRIELNGNYKWSRKAALSTLIHEMCHYYCNMGGYRPLQHHGNEFRAIAFHVSQKSNEFFTVERIAKAEQMDEMELNAVFAEKKKRRADAKASRMIVVLIYMKNGDVRLINAANWNLVGEIERIEAKGGRCQRLLTSQDPELITFLFEKGYRHEMRTYRYWDIAGKPLEKELGRFQFNTRIDNGQTVGLTEGDIKSMAKTCVRRLLNEISSVDAYNKFYAGKIPEEQYKKVMTGAPTMTKLHKRVLDIIAMSGWDEEMVTNLVKLWTTGSNDAKAYAISMMPDSKVSDYGTEEGRSYDAIGMANFLAKVLNMRNHTEAGFVKNGLHVILDNDDILITCTTSYAASMKYYGDSHWCTASDVGGRYNGFKMFGEYTGRDEEGWHEYSALIQMVDKHDRNDSIQMCVTEDGEVDSACWFDDKPIRDDDERGGLDDYLQKFGFRSIDDFLDSNLLSILINETEKCYEEEAPFWEKKSEQVFMKKKAKFVENCKNGYDSTILPMIKALGNDYPWSVNLGSRFNTFPAFSVEEEWKIGSIVALKVRFKGTNEEEYEWIMHQYDGDESSIGEGFDHEVWFVDMNDGRVLNKVKGCVSDRMGKTYIISEYNSEIDWADSNHDSLYRFDGKLLVGDFEPARSISNNSIICGTQHGYNTIYFLEPVKKTGYFYLSMFDVENCLYLGHADLYNLPTGSGVFGIRGWMKFIDPNTGKPVGEERP